MFTTDIGYVLAGLTGLGIIFDRRTISHRPDTGRRRLRDRRRAR